MSKYGVVCASFRFVCFLLSVTVLSANLFGEIFLKRVARVYDYVSACAWVRVCVGVGMGMLRV